ncbi:MAG: 30S ribosomal protein S6 [Candidatus Latescibacterota bacterium]|nr:30S ribosomal protein S6 [Candidatus Latescibacterota bacterium]
MVKKYELVLILDPQVGESSLETTVEKYKTQLEATGAEVVNLDRWGLRKMAYTTPALNGLQQGYYVLYQLQGAPGVLDQLESALKLDESVLRHLIVAVDGEFIRVPALAPDNVYIYNPPDRGGRDRHRGGPRRDRREDGDGPREGAARYDSRDGAVAPKVEADAPKAGADGDVAVAEAPMGEAAAASDQDANE